VNSFAFLVRLVELVRNHPFPPFALSASLCLVSLRPFF